MSALVHGGSRACGPCGRLSLARADREAHSRPLWLEIRLLHWLDFVWGAGALGRGDCRGMLTDHRYMYQTWDIDMCVWDPVGPLGDYVRVTVHEGALQAPRVYQVHQFQ